MENNYNPYVYPLFNRNGIVYQLKNIQLMEFIDKYSHLHKQGTKGWIDSRMRTIGGSEMHQIELIASGNIDAEQKLILNKTGFNTFKGNSHTNWGKLMEPITQNMLSNEMQCTLYETSSLPGCIPGTSYSPDGFAVVKKSVIINLIKIGRIPNHDLPNLDALTVLFEIKSPSTRKPTGEIPKHYVSQPLSGLCHFPFLDIAYFVDVMIRKCSLANIMGASNSYDFSYHNDNVLPKVALAYGLIVISIINKDKKDQKWDSYKTIVDFGASSRLEFESVMEGVVNNELKPTYLDTHNMGDYNESDLKYEMLSCMNYIPNVIGFIPYKIFDYRIIPVQRIDGYVQKYAPIIDRVIGNIKIINDEGSKYTNENDIKTAKMEMINKLYPNDEKNSEIMPFRESFVLEDSMLDDTLKAMGY